MLPPVKIARHAPMVDMSEAAAENHIVKDVLLGPTTAGWRWTMQNPTVTVRVQAAIGLKFHTEFTLPDATFRDTGPVTIRFFVNDHELAAQRYDSAGVKQFEAPVPPAYLHAGADNTLGAEIDKVWVSKHDGARLGFILSRIGLQP